MRTLSVAPDNGGELSDAAKRLLLVDHLLEVRRLAVELTGGWPQPLAAKLAREAADLAAERLGLAAMAVGACEVIAELFRESLNDK